MQLDRLDHLVLTTQDRAACVDFYTRIMGMRLETFGEGRLAFHYGQQKINLHERGREFEPKAHLPVPGALDLCFVTQAPLEAVIAHLEREGWPLLGSPSERTGACGPMRSLYLRDPDLNLIEIAEYPAGH